MLKKILIIITLLFLISGCSYLEGMKSINTTETQILIEKKLIQNTTLENQNITITNSIVTAIKNLKNLQTELNKLNQSIGDINSDLENQTNNNNLNPETINYLNQLNKLTQKSSIFISELYKSTKTWENYLISKNATNLNFTDDSSEIINSIEDPLKAFEE